MSMGGRCLQWSRFTQTERYRGKGEERATQIFSLWRCWHLAGFAYFLQIFLRPQKRQSWNAASLLPNAPRCQHKTASFRIEVLSGNRTMSTDVWAKVLFPKEKWQALNVWTDEDAVNLKKQNVMAWKLYWGKSLLGELNINHLAKFIISVFPFFPTLLWICWTLLLLRMQFPHLFASLWCFLMLPKDDFFSPLLIFVPSPLSW